MSNCNDLIMNKTGFCSSVYCYWARWHFLFDSWVYVLFVDITTCDSCAERNSKVDFNTVFFVVVVVAVLPYRCQLKWSQYYRLKAIIYIEWWDSSEYFVRRKIPCSVCQRVRNKGRRSMLKLIWELHCHCAKLYFITLKVKFSKIKCFLPFEIP